MSLKQLQDQYNDLSEKVDGIRTINQLPTKIAPDGTEYTPISEPDGSGGWTESKIPVGALHGAKWKEISDNYTLTLADRNSNIAVIVTAKTITLPNDLGWQNGDKCYIYQRVLNLTLDHSAVTTEIPQTLEDVQYCIYQITKEGRESDTDIYNITQVGVATSGGGGGTSNITYPGDITATATTLSNSLMGFEKLNRFVKDTAQTITVDTSVITTPCIFNGFRKGTGTLEIIEGTGVRLSAVRNEQNRIFVDGNNKAFSIALESDTKGEVIGALIPGSQGAVTITSYSSTAISEAETKTIDVVGTGFSANMLVTATQNATVSNFVFTDSENISFDVTATGSNDDTIGFEFYNGESLTVNDVITIGQVYFIDDYPFKAAFFPVQLNGGNLAYFRARRVNDGAETDVYWKANGKADGTSSVEAGGDLDTWRGGNDIVAARIYNAGTSGGYMFNADPDKMPKASSGGTLHLWNGSITFDYDGVDDELETTFSDTWVDGHQRIITAFNFTDGGNSTIVSSKTSSNGGFIFKILSSNMQFSSAGNVGADDLALSTSTEYLATVFNDTTDLKIFLGETEELTMAMGAGASNDETIKVGGLIANDNAQFEGFIRYVLVTDHNYSLAEMATIRGELNTLLS